MSDQTRSLAGIELQAVRARSLTRAFDLVCAATGLVFLSPAIVFIALAIKRGSAGPVFYRQERVGKGFRSFRLLKFRTMIVGADLAGLLTAPADARVTRLGRFLRQYKLDELPQLFNVLVGNMQLVGPRPEVPKYVEIFRAQYELLLREPPGITDPASIAYRREDKHFSAPQIEEQYVSEILPHKLKLSLQYQARRTFSSDLGVLLRTLLGIL